MPLKNGNTVGLERRMDLASLFCMIGRHGPAVALAVIAMMSVLAGFIIYRSVRGKRRKQATDTDTDTADDGDGDGDGDGKSPGAERDRDASVESWPSPEESHSSTDVSDEGSSDVQDDADLFRRDVKIRHRRAAAAAAKPPPRKSDVQIPDDTEAVAVVQDSYKVVEKDAEEATQTPQRDSYAGAEMEVEDAGDRRRGATDEKEPWFINDEEKASEADDQEDVNVATDKDVSGQKTGQEEDNRVCFDQTPRTSDDGRQDDEATPETNNMESTLEEPVNRIEDVPVSCVCYAKDEEFEEESRPSDCIDDSDSFSNPFSAEEEEEEECEVQQLVPQCDETRPSKSEQEPNLDQCDYVTDRVTPPIPCSGLDDNGGLAGERIDEDDVPTADELQMEREDVNGLACDKEDGALLSAADIEKEKIPTSDDSVAGGERLDISGAAHGPSLESVENHEDDLSCVNGDTTDIVDFPLDCQQPQSERRVEEFDEDTDLAFPGADQDRQYEKSETEESVDPHCPPPYEDRQRVISEAVDETSVTAAPDTVTCEAENIMAAAKDQQSMRTIDNEALDESSDSAGPDPTETISEEESCPHLPSVCQDQKIDHSEIVETATEAAVCDMVSITTPVTSEETSHPETFSFSGDQGSDQMQNNEDPLTPMYQIHLPSFGSASSPGVRVESGISSMAVSPDSQDAAGEFGETVEDMMMPDCDPPSEDSTEAQNGLYADDLAVHVIHEDTAGWVFGPYPPRPPQRPRGDQCDSFAANEDAFGHEIEDGYHRALERLMAQIAANAASSAAEPNERADVTADVDFVGLKEMKEDVRIAKKMETEAEEEKEADYERTEISIMEATMDNNEWITDNYQVHPWMNLSGPSFSQDHAQTEELPAGGCLLLASSSCTEADTEPPTEVEQTDALPAVEENAESNNKKVVVVQPVPQSVDVTFRIHYLTRSPYQTVGVTGNRQELGNWKDFVPLERAKDGHWAVAVRLPAESRVEWKFVLGEKGEVRRWEECGNRLLDTGCGDELTVHKWWGLL